MSVWIIIKKKNNVNCFTSLLTNDVFDRFHQVPPQSRAMWSSEALPGGPQRCPGGCLSHPMSQMTSDAAASRVAGARCNIGAASPRWRRVLANVGNGLPYKKRYDEMWDLRLLLLLKSFEIPDGHCNVESFWTPIVNWSLGGVQLADLGFEPGESYCRSQSKAYFVSCQDSW